MTSPLDLTPTFHDEVATIAAGYLGRLVSQGVPLDAALVLTQDYQRMIATTLYRRLHSGSEETPIQ